MGATETYTCGIAQPRPFPIGGGRWRGPDGAGGDNVGADV